MIFNVDAQATNQFLTNFPVKKQLPESRLKLNRRSQANSFYDVLGRKSAAFGYEHRGLEAWVYPLKIVDDFELSFKVENYNLGFRGSDLLTNIDVRPEATTFTYSHAAFTVRQIVFAPIEEPGLVMLLDIKTTLPMTIEIQFRPKLKPAWPGNLMTASVSFDEKQNHYLINEETERFYGIVGTPKARDVSLMPYQEEPQDVPVRYQVQISPETAEQYYIPIVIAGSVEGRARAVQNYQNLLANAFSLYEKNVDYYENLLESTTEILTPDERLNTAFAWAKIGIDKGLATNPYLGTGLLAGFRTSGESERAGFAWFFGRDALWTALAINSYGDFATTRTALEFLQKFQRADGKIPHEISQSATLVDWWKGYPYAWASSDATVLYVIVHADYFRLSGDTEFLRRNWESIKKAYRFSEVTDTDNNGLIENTRFGHAWVEGGALYPPHEEIYLQGIWVEASRNLAEMADALGVEVELAQKSRANAERTKAAIEKTFWLEDKNYYAYATKLLNKDQPKAEPGPNRERRQKRLNELASSNLFDENTVLPAVPLWWRLLPDEKAQKQIDQLGGSEIATDWGARILSNISELYDPLSYHNGSVWPLFTGWQAQAAYNYGRPHIGFQALMANALLSFSNALGFATELLSGDFNAPFGRSSHHQVWSEAMIVTPLVRGMLGIEVLEQGQTIRFAPQLPANWKNLEVKNIRAADAKFDFKIQRSSRGVLSFNLANRSSKLRPTKLILAPAFPLDAKIKNVIVAGKSINFQIRQTGDVQFAEIEIELKQNQTEISFQYDEGTEVYLVPENLIAGAENSGLKIINARPDKSNLFLSLEGRSGQTYSLNVMSPKQFRETENVKIKNIDLIQKQFKITFPAEKQDYLKSEIRIPFSK